MANLDETEVLARVGASLGRRILGIGCLAVLGVLVIYIAFATPPGLQWQVFLLVLGLVSLWMANAMRLATGQVIELTENELRDSSGQTIVTLDDIQSVDRSVFAFKPSNGFLLKTRIPGPRTWRPGLWWRVGNRIGVGGMTVGRETKFMSEIIAVKLAEREN